VRKSVIQLFGGNLLSKVLGFSREIVVATLFGTGSVIGAYRVAQTGTLAPINFFTSDALNSAFVPQYKFFQYQSTNHVQTFFWGVFIIFCFLAIFIGSTLWFFGGFLVNILAPGIDLGTANLSIQMLQVMGLGVPFYLLSSILMFLGMANEDFVPMASRAIVQNLGLISGTALAYFTKNVLFLAWGFSASYLVFATWVYFRMLFAGYLTFPTYIERSLIKIVMKSFWITLRPLLLLPVMLQGNIVIERIVASLIGLIAISALDYAKFITETLIMLLAMPIAFSGLTNWSNLSADVMRDRLGKVLSFLLLIAVPISIFLALNAHILVTVIFQRGAFDQESVEVTTDILFGVALGLWAQVVGYVLIKALNSQMQNFATLIIMVAALLGNAAFNLIMYPILGGMTLGLGNTIYGLILVCGTLFALKLWRSFFSSMWIIALGGLIYFATNQYAFQLSNYLGFESFIGNNLTFSGLIEYLPLLKSVWAKLIGSICFAIFFWGLWITLIPPLRHLVIDVAVPNRRRAV
jgi:putative peptidoglycan lipid II flippase